ncbi:MAG TPA: class I SAM-dependent methyltransferase [Pseudonocardiaceae bacterium]
MDHIEERARRASSFGSQAAAYAKYRPDYPRDLLDWALAPVRSVPGLRVLDVGAGTGKLTGGLLALGVDVVAVEPDPAMLAELTTRFPDVATLLGTAEDIPLPDASVNAVFAGQALHWFDLDRALPEFRRVLRPGGFAVAVWNTYDDTVPWVAEFCDVTETIRRGVQRMDGEILGPLGPSERIEFSHRHRQTADDLLNTVATQSQMLVATPEYRADVLARGREVLLSNPATANGPFDVPMITEAIRATPRW